MAACTQVLDTPELLEMILLHLPVLDLQRSKNVQSGWRDACSASSDIQKALFLKPYHDFTIECVEHNDKNGEESDYDRLVESEGQDDLAYFPFKWATSTGKALPMRVIVNPVLTKYLYEDNETRGRGLICQSILVDDFILGCNPADPLEPTMMPWDTNFLSEDAFWRPMLFTQPPISRFGAWCTKRRGWFYRDPSNKLTIDEMHAFLHGHLRLCPNCPRLFDEKNRFMWKGEELVEVVDVNITGFEMLGKLAQRIAK